MVVRFTPSSWASRGQGRARCWWRRVARTRSARVSLGGAGSGCPLPVAAPPLVAVLFPLGAPWACQRGGQIVQIVAGQPGQGGVGQCGTVPSGGGLRPWFRGPAGLARVWVQAVIPVAVEVVAGDGQGGHVLVADLDAGRVGAGVEFGADGEPGAGGGAGDEVDDDFVAGQRSAAPVHRDLAEEPVLDLVPLGGAGREVADGDRAARSGRPVRRVRFSTPEPVSVGSAAVGGDQQPVGVGVGEGADLATSGGSTRPRTRRCRDRIPPTPSRCWRRCRTPRTGWSCPAPPVEVMDTSPVRTAAGSLLAARVAVVADQFLLLRVDGDHRLAGGDVRRRPGC